MLTANRVREVLNYTPETGIFTWGLSIGRAMAGSVAGGIHHSGYRDITINRRKYKAHRLAWLYIYGAWPLGEIDHINSLSDDNRIANLRIVTRSQNMQNQRRARKDNKVGMLGVRIIRGRFVAYIGIGNKKYKHIGSYPSIIEAHNAYVSAKRKLHETCTI